MFIGTDTASAVLIAYILDLLLGDPEWFPHPVRGIGWLIKKVEPAFRKFRRNEKLSGAFFSFSIIAVTLTLSFAVVRLSFYLNRFLGLGLSSLLIYTSLSVKDLKVHSMPVYEDLKHNDISSARRHLSKIVGRDTRNLDRENIIRACVETIAENTVDGIISPLFYAFIGGAPIALAYKAVNTLDSMVGYKNDKYEKFGWAAAKIDDIANFIPARISAIFLPVASMLSGKNGLNSVKTVMRDGKKNPSPNSGIPEAAFAGALGVQLGGTNFYDSIAVRKPFIGKNNNPLTIKHIRESIRISYVCSSLILVAGLLLFFSCNLLAKGKPVFTIVQLTDTHQMSTPPEISSFSWKHRVHIFGYKLHKLNLSKSSQILENTIKHINEEIKPDLVVITGDIVNTGYDKEAMRNTRNILDRLECAYYPVIGDHDLTDGKDRKENYKDIFGEINYSFDQKGWHIVMLGIYPDESDLEWLKEDLKKNSDKPTILCMHRMLVASSLMKYLAKKYYYPELVSPKAKEIINILNSHGRVVAVLSGHSHTNYHIKRGRTSFISTASLTEPPYEFRIIRVHRNSISTWGSTANPLKAQQK